VSEVPDGIDRNSCLAADMADSLRPLRDRFSIPEGTVYLDGNSLGPLPAGAPARADSLLGEWRDRLVRGWRDRGWMDLPLRLGDRIGSLTGAAPGQVVVCDSTTINLHKLLLGALRLAAPRHVVLTEAGNFHTDLYAASGAAPLLGAEVRRVARENLAEALDDSVAVLLLTHVDFRTGEMHDMEALTRQAHAAGALVLWDLSHSAGAVAVELDECAVDLATGCTYKYLNAGPGAPAYLYVARRHQERLDSPLRGWLGHADPFAFAAEYRAAEGIRRHLTGTPPILQLAVLDAALDAFDGVDVQALRARSLELTALLVDLVDARLAGSGVEVVTPRSPERRGSQVSLRHAQAYGLVQALSARDVVGDFRDPDICRLGVAPLYTSRVEVWDAVEAITIVLEAGEHLDPEYATRAAVT
jgi:kynureninase